MAGANIHSIPTGATGEVIGIQQVIKVPQPSAGAEWTYTFGGGFYYRLLSGTAQFVTSAVVANRNVGIQLSSPEGIIFRNANNSAIVASTTAIPAYHVYSINVFITGAKGAATMLSPGNWIPPGYTLASSTGAMDVGDQYSLVVLWFECWDFGALGQPVSVHRPTTDEIGAVMPSGYR